MEHRAIKQWSVMRSLVLLAAIFAVVVGATLPTAVAASAGVGHPIQLCSGEQVFVISDAAGAATGEEPASFPSLDCAACLAAAFVAVTPAPPTEAAAAASSAHPESLRVPVVPATCHAVQGPPRPPSTAPPMV